MGVGSLRERSLLAPPTHTLDPLPPRPAHSVSGTEGEGSGRAPAGREGGWPGLGAWGLCSRTGSETETHRGSAPSSATPHVPACTSLQAKGTGNASSSINTFLSLRPRYFARITCVQVSSSAAEDTFSSLLLELRRPVSSVRSTPRSVTGSLRCFCRVRWRAPSLSFQ